MKKFSILIAISCLFCSEIYAQKQDQSTLSVSYAIMPAEDALRDVLLRYVNTLMGGRRNLVLRKGSFFVTYKYHVTEKFALGAAAGYNAAADENKYTYFDRHKTRRTAFTIAFESTFYWVKKKNFQLYSLAGAGVFHKKIDKDGLVTTDAGPSFQVTPAGIRFGREVGIFLEVGSGYKGAANGGVSLVF